MGSLRNNRLCNACASSFDTPLPNKTESGGTHQRTYQALETAASNDCYVCVRVRMKVEEALETTGTSEVPTRSRYLIVPHNCDNRILEVRVEVGLGMSWIASRFRIFEQSQYPKMEIADALSPSIRHQESVQTVNKWRRHCEDFHLNCRRDQSSAHDISLPTRLLNIQKLQDVTSFRVRLCYTSKLPANTRYLSFSHAWGTQRFLTLEKANHDAFLNSIPLVSLSRSFQDALHITHLLEFQYIWIDSLCIIQDDPLDWETESARMAAVYKNASINLSAAAFESGMNGFLPLQRSTNPVPARIHIDSLNSERSYVLTETEPWKLIWNAPLFRRAWVLQEQALATRAVHFGQDQIHWECQDLYANEVWPLGLPTHPIPTEKERKEVFQALYPHFENPFQSLFLKQRQKLSYWHFSFSSLDSKQSVLDDAWKSIVEDYSRRLITYASDRLPALAGLASEFARTRKGDEYMHGVWKRDLHRQLLWKQARPHRNLYKPLPASQPDWSLQPSWSWVALGAAVSWDGRLYPSGTAMSVGHTPLATILEKDNGLPYYTLHMLGRPFKFGLDEEVHCRLTDHTIAQFLVTPVASFRGLAFDCTYEVDEWFLQRLRKPDENDPHELLRKLVKETIVLPLLWWENFALYGAIGLLLMRDAEFGRGMYRRVGRVIMESDSIRIGREHLEGAARKCQREFDVIDVLEHREDESCVVGVV